MFQSLHRLALESNALEYRTAKRSIPSSLHIFQASHSPGFPLSLIGYSCLSFCYQPIERSVIKPDIRVFADIDQQGWGNFHQALLSLFHFLSPFLRTGELQHVTRDIYQGATRVLIVLLHDFPDFLSEYYFSICDAIPPRCIQLRNLVLSAFPATITLPDPYMRSIRLDVIPEMGPIPPTRFDITSGLKSNDLGSILEALIFNRGPPSFLQSLKDRLRLSDAKELALGSYNLSAINAVVVYVGMSSVAQAKARSGSHTFSPTDPGVGILSYLANQLDPEGEPFSLSVFETFG